MNEPSVLDYVKARLKFWQKTTLHIPDLPRDTSAAPEEMDDAAMSEVSGGTLVHTADVPEPDAARQGALAGVHFPWLVILPLGAAILGQFFLEPPARFAAPAVVLYMVSAVLGGLAYARGVLVPADYPDAAVRVDDGAFHWQRALLALPFTLAGFVLFAGNRFSLLNTALWLVGIILFIAAFAREEALPPVGAWARGIIQSIRKPNHAWTIKFNGWTLLVIGVLALVTFFRFYRLDTLPIDMVSDHAEKLLDVNDLLNGKTSIFFERNTGREPFQFYWTALVIKVFGLDVSFFSLKLGTVLVGLITLFYIYHLGRLIGGRWVALIALILAGVAYWPNVISRIALRFPLYPMFVAPLMFHLIRALRENSRNDYLWAGIWLGIGLNGYTSGRIVPFLVVAAVGLYLLHRQSRGYRAQALIGLMLAAFMALLICLPLARYALENPDGIFFRSLTRLGTLERPIEGSPLTIFLGNFWAVITMFFYNNGSIWPHSIPFRPALDVVMAALFFSGVVLLIARYIKRRKWEDLLLLVSVPILLLPSALSIAFPGENPSLNRTAGAYVPVFIIAALGLEALLSGLVRRLPNGTGRIFATAVGVVLLTWTIGSNYNLFFHQYADNYRASAWNTREIGAVVRDFAGLAGTYDTYYVVGFPYWIDSRQVAIFAGHIERDPAVLPEQLAQTTADPRMKMYLVKPEDLNTLAALRAIYPQGWAELHQSDQAGKEFVVFLVPATETALP